MSAADRILPLLTGVRSRGSDRWIFICPAHPDKSPSGELRQAEDRGLILCRAGCTSSQIVGALGLSLADLYNTPLKPWHRDPAADLRQAAAAGLRHWRTAETRRLREELRMRDMARLAACMAFDAGTFSEIELYICLGEVYRDYSWLEHHFEILCMGTDQNALELWRQSRGVTHAA